MKKTLIAVVSTVLICCCVFGGTLAWLMDKTESITNTFTVGNVDITLTETGATDNAQSFKMVPGSDIAKDPKVTVEAGSEECYVFIKIEKANDFDNYMTYTIADGWTAVAGADGVYSRLVKTDEMGTPISVLKDDKVTVKNTVTKDMMDDINDNTVDAPTLTFTAYAVQKANVDNAAAAWDLAKAL